MRTLEVPITNLIDTKALHNYRDPPSGHPTYFLPSVRAPGGKSECSNSSGSINLSQRRPALTRPCHWNWYLGSLGWLDVILNISIFLSIVGAEPITMQDWEKWLTGPREPITGLVSVRFIYVEYNSQFLCVETGGSDWVYSRLIMMRLFYQISSILLQHHWCCLFWNISQIRRGIRTINICISPDNIDTSQMSPERERVILPLPSPPPDLVEMMNTKYFRKFHFFCLSHSRGFSAFVSKVFLYRNSFYNIFNDLSHGAPTFSIVNQFNWTFTWSSPDLRGE